MTRVSSVRIRYWAFIFFSPSSFWFFLDDARACYPGLFSFSISFFDAYFHQTVLIHVQSVSCFRTMLAIWTLAISPSHTPRWQAAYGYLTSRMADLRFAYAPSLPVICAILSSPYFPLCSLFRDLSCGESVW